MRMRRAFSGRRLKEDFYFFFLDVQVANVNAKLRWLRKVPGYGEDEEQEQGGEEPDKEIEMLDLPSRETYNPINKVFDFGKEDHR